MAERRATATEASAAGAAPREGSAAAGAALGEAGCAPAPRCFLIDGSALAYRSYFARGPGPAFAYASSLLSLVDRGRPDYAIVAMDTPHPTFRHEAYADYKATREKTPPDLVAQLPLFERIAKALGFPIYALVGWEADDVIGTLARRAEAAGHEVFIVTGDKDFMQCVGERVHVWNPSGPNGEPVLIGVEAVRHRFHCRPDQVIDVLGLMGDHSDNIPGVPHVGEKTALKLIEGFEHLEDLYESLDGIKPPGLQARLREGRELAFLSRDLATIRCEAPITVELESLRYAGPDVGSARELFVELDYPSLVQKLGSSARQVAEDTRDYHVVCDAASYEELLRRLRLARELVIDLETTSIVPLEAEIVGIAIAFAGHEAFYLPANLPEPIFGAGERSLTARERFGGEGGDGRAAGGGGAGGLFSGPGGARTTGRGVAGDPLVPPPGSDLARFLADLRPVLENPAVAVVGQNLKYDLHVLARYGLVPARIAFDTMLASYCVQAHQSQHGLDFLSLKHLGVTKIPTSELIGKGKAQIGMWDVPPARCGEYACEDADMTFRLYREFQRELEGNPVEPVFREIEMPLLPVLQRMEAHGVLVDGGVLRAISAEMAERIDALAAEVYGLAGCTFSIASPKQLGEVLFEKLRIHEQLGVKRIRRTKTGFSTDAEVLESLSEHPIAAKLLEHRQLCKLKSTYVDALPQLIHPVTGRIHTSFNQAVASTGRLSSSDPNLQNIPIRTREGRRIRQAFVAEPGHVLLAADYSQVELRLMAHLSGDAALRQAFLDGEDVHRRTAALVFGVAADAVTPDMRSQAKTINFGIIYGMGATRLARQIGLTQSEAAAFIERYFGVFSGVRAWLDATRAEALRQGFVSTLTGRRRKLDTLDSDDPRLAASALNVAVNTPLQGTAADLIKIAMIRLHAELPRRGLHSRMLLQVHDELVFEAPEAELDALTPLVRETMENAMALDVPLVVTTGTGGNWVEAH